MKRVVIVASFAESVVTFRGRLIRALLDSGVEVHVLAPGLGTDTPEFAELTGLGVACHDIELSRTGVNPFKDLIYMCRLFARMRRLRPDLTLCYTVKPVVYGGLAAWAAKVPRRIVLVTGLGYAFGTDAGIVSKIVRWLYRVSLAKAGHVFFQNPDDERLFIDEGLLDVRTPHSVVNGSGIDLRDFPERPVPAGDAVFLLIARLIRAKGVCEFVEAARIVRTEFPSARFRLAGWLDDNPDSIGARALQEIVDGGVVEFIGKLADVRPALTQATVYVLPSYREGTPRTVLEAMATGRPIVTTDAPGCRETVVDGENGFLVPVAETKPLAEAMMRFLRDPALAAAMGARSRRIAETKYDVEKVNRAMLKAMGVGE